MSYPICPNCGKELKEALYVEKTIMPVWDDDFSMSPQNSHDSDATVYQDIECPSCGQSVSGIIDLV